MCISFNQCSAALPIHIDLYIDLNFISNSAIPSYVRCKYQPRQGQCCKKTQIRHHTGVYRTREDLDGVGVCPPERTARGVEHFTQGYLCLCLCLCLFVCLSLSPSLCICVCVCVCLSHSEVFIKSEENKYKNNTAYKIDPCTAYSGT